MAEEKKKFKMLLKDGKGMPFPFRDDLMKRGDMKIQWMTAEAINKAVKQLERNEKTEYAPASETEMADDEKGKQPEE